MNKIYFIPSITQSQMAISMPKKATLLLLLIFYGYNLITDYLTYVY